MEKAKLTNLLVTYKFDNIFKIRSKSIIMGLIKITVHKMEVVKC